MTSPHHPAPARGQLSAWSASILLYAGPIAWLAEMGAGLALTSPPCFLRGVREAAPPSGGGASVVALAIGLACALVAAAAGAASWRLWRRVRHECGGDHADLAEVGHGRTRFLALWGMCLGVGSAIITLITLAGFMMVPRCLG